MAIAADILLTPHPIGMSVTLPPSRLAVAPVSERDGTGHQQRRDPRGSNNAATLSFRAALSAAMLGGVAQASRVTETQDGAPARFDDAKAAPRRASRLPSDGALELSGAEAADLFNRAIANNARKSRAPEYVAATSRYTASYFAGSTFHARPGETLELTV